ncbi:MAG: hypothetical protein ACP5FK_03680 [bacterium]
MNEVDFKHPYFHLRTSDLADINNPYPPKKSTPVNHKNEKIREVIEKFLKLFDWFWV